MTPGLTLEQRALLDWQARALAGQPLVPLITVVGDGAGRLGLLFSRQWVDGRIGKDPAVRDAAFTALVDEFRRLLYGEETPPCRTA